MPEHRIRITKREWVELWHTVPHSRLDRFLGNHPHKYRHYEVGYGIYGFRLGCPQNENGEYVVYLTTGSHCD